MSRERLDQPGSTPNPVEAGSSYTGESFEKRLANDWLPVLIFSKHWYDDLRPSEQQDLGQLMIEGRKVSYPEEEAICYLAQTLLSRLSWLVPASSLSQACSSSLPEAIPRRRSSCPSGRELLLLKERYVPPFLGRYPGTWASIGRDRRVAGKRERISGGRAKTIAEDAAMRIYFHAKRVEVETLTGRRRLASVLEENLDLILEETIVRRVVPDYGLAPEAIWEKGKFVIETAEKDKELRRVLAKLNLSPPYDFLFSRQVLLPLSVMHYYFPELAPYFLVDSFQKQLEAELGVSSQSRSFFPLKEIVRERMVSPTDFETRPSQQTRLYNLLKRAGLETWEQLLEMELKALLEVKLLGEKSIPAFYPFLAKYYPEEELTREVAGYLQKKGLI